MKGGTKMATKQKDGPSLADVAESGLASVPEPEGPDQGVFENTDYSKITFLGTNYQSLDYRPKIGEEVEFVVRGRIKEIGDRQMANGFTQHFGKVDVSSVMKHEA